MDCFFVLLREIIQLLLCVYSVGIECILQSIVTQYPAYQRFLAGVLNPIDFLNCCNIQLVILHISVQKAIIILSTEAMIQVQPRPQAYPYEIKPFYFIRVSLGMRLIPIQLCCKLLATTLKPYHLNFMQSHKLSVRQLHIYNLALYPKEGEILKCNVTAQGVQTFSCNVGSYELSNTPGPSPHEPDIIDVGCSIILYVLAKLLKQYIELPRFYRPIQRNDIEVDQM